MHEAQALINTHNGDHSRGAPFLAVLLEEVEKAAREERGEVTPRHPSPAPPIRRQTAKPEQSYTVDYSRD